MEDEIFPTDYLKLLVTKKQYFYQTSMTVTKSVFTYTTGK